MERNGDAHSGHVVGDGGLLVSTAWHDTRKRVVVFRTMSGLCRFCAGSGKLYLC